MNKWTFREDKFQFLDYFYKFRKNNEVWLINPENGTRKAVKNNGEIEGLEILFPNGEGNIVEIETPYKFNKTQIRLTGSNGKIYIKRNCSMYNQFINIGSNGKCEIGENFYSTQNGRFYVGSSNLQIGHNCLFSREICIYCDDGHKILDNKKKSVINTQKNGVVLQNNIWVGDSVFLLKGTKLASNTVIGARTLISKEFTEENTLIYGTPARVQKSGINWVK